MRAIDKFIIHVVNNLFPLNEYSEGEVKRLIKHFQDEADEKNITIDDKLLAKYIQQFDKLKSSNHAEIGDKREIRHWPLQKLVRLVSRYAEEDEEDWDPGLEVVYEEGPYHIWNGSEEDRCIKYAKNKSPWCIGKGSFMNYRGDANKGNPVFYLCMNDDLPESNRLSFVAIQVRNPEVKGDKERYVYTNRKNDPYESTPMSWEQLNSQIPWLRNIPNVKDLLKYIPLSPKQKQGSQLRYSMPVKKWMDLPLNYKKQFLLNRKGERQFLSDIENDKFLTKYISKIPSLMQFIATNAGIFSSEDLLQTFPDLDKQSQNSILKNLHDKVNFSLLFTDQLSFEVKRLVTFKKLWNVNPIDYDVYLTDNEKAIGVVKTSDGTIKLGYLTDDEEHENVKITKNTSKYLLGWEALEEDGTYLFSLAEIAQLYGLNQELNQKLDKKIEMTSEVTGDNYDIDKVEKDDATYYVDHKANQAFKKEKYTFKEIPFDDLETILGAGTTDKAKSATLEMIKVAFNDETRFNTRLKKETAVKVLKSLPYNEREIDTSRAKGPILVSADDETLFVKQSKVNQYTSLYSDADFRRVNRSKYMTTPMWESFFEYLKSINVNYNWMDVTSFCRNAQGERERVSSILDWFEAKPPLDLRDTQKLLTHEGELYFLDSEDRDRSFKLSSRSYKPIKTGLSPAKFNQLMGIATPQRQVAAPAATPTTTPAAEPQAQNAGGTVDVGAVAQDAGLLDQVRQLPRAVVQRIGGQMATVESVAGSRAAQLRNTALGNIGRVTQVLRAPDNHNRIFVIRVGETTILDIRSNGTEYAVLPGRAPEIIANFSDIIQLIQRANLAEVTQTDIVRALIAEQVYNEISLKKAAAIGAMGLATLGSPKGASGQNFQGLKDKFKAGITAVQNKIKPQQKVDTVKIQKDAPLELAKFKDFKGAGYGFAQSINQSTAKSQAYLNAKTDLMKKMDKTQITAGFEIKDSKMYQLPNGTYQCEVIVVLGNTY